MSTALAPEPKSAQRYTAEDLLRMPDGDLYELVDGKLVEREMGAESAFLAGEIHGLIRDHVKKHKLGWAFPDNTSYDCFGDEQTNVLKPDVSFIRRGRLPEGKVPVGFISIPPDLVVEVLSPTDLIRLVDEKVDDYLSHAVSVVWVVHPSAKMIRVYRPQGEDAQLRRDAILEEPDLLPGFKLSLKELFASTLED